MQLQLAPELALSSATIRDMQLSVQIAVYDELMMHPRLMGSTLATLVQGHPWGHPPQAWVTGLDGLLA